jgi:hypothetical protein
MSKSITVIERHMIRGPIALIRSVPFGRKLIKEWQQRGPETLSRHAVSKLRLAFAPLQCATTADVVG